MNIDGQPHPHSFLRDGSETRNVVATSTDGKGIEVRSAISGLLVLKSTGSEFHGFYRNEYTALKETWDRILSTEVDAGWLWNTFKTLKDVESAVPEFDKTWDEVRTVTLKKFAQEESASVQNTMYHMCEDILAAAPTVQAVDYSLPNKHYFEIGKFLFAPFGKGMTLQVWLGRDADTASRFELAQGLEKYWRGRRGLRSPVRPQWSYPVHCQPMSPVVCSALMSRCRVEWIYGMLRRICVP